MEELYQLRKRRSSKMILLKKDIEDQIYDVVMATEIVGLWCVYPERKIVRKQQNKHGVVVGKTNWAVLATYSTFLMHCLQLVQQSPFLYVQCWRWCYNEGVSKALQYLLPFHTTWGLSLWFLPLPRWCFALFCIYSFFGTCNFFAAWTRAQIPFCLWTLHLPSCRTVSSKNSWVCSS